MKRELGGHVRRNRPSIAAAVPVEPARALAVAEEGRDRLVLRLRKGDRVKLTGYFQNRSYRRGHPTRQLVVVSAEPLKLKAREEVA